MRCRPNQSDRVPKISRSAHRLKRGTKNRRTPGLQISSELTTKRLFRVRQKCQTLYAEQIPGKDIQAVLGHDLMVAVLHTHRISDQLVLIAQQHFDQRKKFIAGKVRSGYPKENGLTKTADYLPSSISIRQDLEFAFSNWISYAYLGYYPYR
jgi:hypothetical protein